jgi:hypothetical protein
MRRTGFDERIWLQSDCPPSAPLRPRGFHAGRIGGEAFAVDASMIVADAHRRRGVAKVEGLGPASSRAVAEYLSVLDDAAFGGPTPTEPKAISPTDPAARYTRCALRDCRKSTVENGRTA